MAYSSFPAPTRSRKRDLFKFHRNKTRRIKLLSTLIMIGFGFFVFGLLGLIITFGVVAKDLPSPTKLQTRDVNLSTKIFDRHGELLYDIYGDENRTLVTLDKIPKDLKNATVAIEDKNFYKHEGFDLVGILRSVKNIAVYGDIVGGGSTLTQQLVKNALLSSETTFTRKFKELILALLIEQKYSKDEILQMYLNEVPYGGTAAGVEAAANQYFNKSVKDLSLVESAILAGFPQLPSTYSPYNTDDPNAYVTRTKDVLRRMREDGYISKDQETQAKADLEHVEFAKQGNNIKAPHFVMYVRDQLVEKYGEKAVLSGGLQVTTSLDYSIQEKAQDAVTKELEKPEYARLKVGNGAAVVQDPKTGEILGMVGSKDYFDTDHDGNYNVATALRQPGSSIKPINYVTGFKKGYNPATMFLDIPTEFSNGEGQEPYKPKNYDGKFHGPTQIRYALGNSYNIPAVKMLYVNGVKEMLNTAKDMGISTLTDENRYGLSLTLGGGEVRLVEMVDAYSAFANGGIRVDPVSILRVTNSHGKILEEFKPSKGRQVLKPEHAFLISDILSDPTAKYAAFGESTANNILGVKGHKIAVKTGTTDETKDNWTIGYTPSYTVGVWVGNNDNKPMGAVVSGITGAAPIWHNIFTEILKGTKDEPFQKPSGIVQMEVDKVSGMKPGPYSERRLEYFDKSQVPQREDDMHKKVRICTPTGKLATQTCIDSGQTEDKVFLVMYDPMTKQYCDQCPPSDSDTGYYNPSGKEEPTVKITTPDSGDNLDREFDVKAEVSSPYTLTRVDFMFDNSILATSTTPPFEYIYEIPDYIPAGKHTVSVRAIDSAGNVGAAQAEVTIIK